METKLERELSLLIKCLKINYNGKIISGENAFKQLTIDCDILGKDYAINWDSIPVSINIL